MPRISKPRRHGKRWRINFLDADGARQWETFRTYREAADALHRRKAESEAIRTGVSPRLLAPHTFGELCDYWLEHEVPRKRSPKDHRSIIRAHLRPAFGGMELAGLGARQLDEFQKARRHLSSKTVRNHLTLLGSMLNKAVELGWLVAAPRIRKPKLEQQDFRWLRSSEDLGALLEAAQEEAPGVMELYATALYTGMRAGELLGLTWGEVHFEQRLITVKRSYDKATKNTLIRHVPILDPLLPVLQEWRLQCPVDVVFPGETGLAQGPGARVLQEVLQRCLDRARLVGPNRPYKRITFHDLRHTFASHWVMREGDIFRLQKILGHQSMQMTQRYAHLAPEVYSQEWGRLVDVVPREAEVLPFAGSAMEEEG